MRDFRLRDYQRDCSDKILAAWETDPSVLLVIYTGGGKTVIFADIIRRMHPRRAIVLAHREELVWQAKQKIEATTGLACGIEMADTRISTHPGLDGLVKEWPVVVATVQSLNAVMGDRKRMSKFRPQDFSVLIIDESHHATARSYRNVINYFQQNPNLKVLGVTATPVRADKEALGQVFTKVAAEYPILTGIKDGWLCDITQQFSTVASLDYSHIRTTAGDLNGADLAAVMEAESNIVGVCQPSLEVLFGLVPHTLDQTPVPEWGQYLRSLNRQARRTIVFTASVVQAELCCNIFNRVIPGMSDWICGETNKDKRRGLLEKFSRGEIRVMMNCGIFTEGFDDPGVEVIIMARPTKSQGLYCQMIGRATRPLPGVVDGTDLDTPEKRLTSIASSGKPFCRIVDFVGNSGPHKLITCFDVLGGKVSERTLDFAIRRVAEEGKPVRVSRALDKAEIQLKEEMQRKADERRRQEAARKAHLVARSRFSIRPVDAFRLSERSAAAPIGNRYAVKRPPSFAQARMLLANGINPSHISFHQARGIIGKIIAKRKAKVV